jgi:hypothetical protein
MKYNIEITDTYGGEANYCWVKRLDIEVDKDASDLSLIRKVKKAVGWNGIRCRTDILSDMIQLTPSGMCQTMFVTPLY